MELFHTTDKRDWYRTVYLLSDHWKELRARKLATHPACEDCGSRDRVEPHHLRYRHIFDVTVADLRSLCRRHHTEWHKVRPPPKSLRPRFRFRATNEIRSRNNALRAIRQAGIKRRWMERKDREKQQKREFLAEAKAQGLAFMIRVS